MLKNTFYPALIITAALLVFGLLLAPPALAVTFTVNSTADLPDDLTLPGTCHTVANTCTLRAAIMQANRTSGAGATIRLPAGVYTLTIPAAGANGEENGDLNLTTPPTLPRPVISIIGAGADQTIIDGNQLDRVLLIDRDREVSITGVTIRNGYATPGGGIFNYNGKLTVTNSTISGNQANYGGGIHSIGGTVKVTNSTISGNQANADGGGINTEFVLIGEHSNLVVSNSTISGNQANSGGGIYNQGGPATVTNSTISGNQAQSTGGAIVNFTILIMVNTTISQNTAGTDGGGIYNGVGGNANVYNSTITQNDALHYRQPIAGSGGGVYNSAIGIFNLRNSLVAGNSRLGALTPDDCYGILGYFGWNLFGYLTGCTRDTSSENWGQFSGSLGPLQNNGGPTWTHALQPGSNAINGGDLVQGCTGPDGLPLATDQRGAARVVGVRCDIGAFEYGALIPLLYLPMVISN